MADTGEWRVVVDVMGGTCEVEEVEEVEAWKSRKGSNVGRKQRDDAIVLLISLLNDKVEG